MAKPARKVTGRSDGRSSFMPVATPRIKRGTRVLLRNVTLAGGRVADIPAYVSVIQNGVATLDTWDQTRLIMVPVADLGRLARGAA
jgi:hypothetical protein